jgi:hypothetical protein
LSAPTVKVGAAFRIGRWPFNCDRFLAKQQLNGRLRLPLPFRRIACEGLILGCIQVELVDQSLAISQWCSIEFNEKQSIRRAHQYWHFFAGDWHVSRELFVIDVDRADRRRLLN